MSVLINEIENISNDWKKLKNQWDNSKQFWKDNMQRKFEQKFWNESERILPFFLKELKTTDDLISRAYSVLNIRDNYLKPGNKNLRQNQQQGNSSRSTKKGIYKALKDKNFKDKNGKSWTMRIYSSKYLRVFNTGSNIPTNPTTSSSYANFSIEKDTAGNNTRLKLQDIVTDKNFQNSGIGSQMLNKVESIAKSYNVNEIYGLAPTEIAVRNWYTKRGYGFKNESGLEHIFKKI